MLVCVQFIVRLQLVHVSVSLDHRLRMGMVHVSHKPDSGLWKNLNFKISSNINGRKEFKEYDQPNSSELKITSYFLYSLSSPPVSVSIPLIGTCRIPSAGCIQREALAAKIHSVGG